MKKVTRYPRGMNPNWRTRPNARTLALAASVAVLRDEGFTRREIVDELEIPYWLVSDLVSTYCDRFVTVSVNR